MKRLSFIIVFATFNTLFAGVEEGKQALRHKDLTTAHNAFISAAAQNANDPEANLMLFFTTWGMKYQNPGSKIDSILTSFNMEYTQNVFAERFSYSYLNNEAYTDLNGNGTYDRGESYYDWNSNGTWDVGEWFADYNFNGVYDTKEPFVDSNGNQKWDKNLIPAGASSINSVFDTLNSDVVSTVDKSLAQLKQIQDNTTISWKYKLTRDLFKSNATSDVTIDKLDITLAEAALNLVKFGIEFGHGYNFNVDYQTVTASGWELTENYWKNQGSFFTVRNAPSFADSKNSLRASLTKVQSALNLLTDSQYDTGFVATNLRKKSSWKSNDIDDAKTYISKALSSLDHNTTISRDGYDDITVKLGALFDSPLDHNDMPGFKTEIATNKQSFDVTNLPNPAFNGLFPTFTNKAKIYAAYTHYLAPTKIVPNPTEQSTGQFLENTENPRFSWNVSRARYGYNYYPYPTGPVLLKDDLKFEEKVSKFNIYRSLTGPKGSFNKIATLAIGTFAPRAIWSYEDTSGVRGQLCYKVGVEFVSDDGGRAETLFHDDVSLSYDENNNYIADWWESKYGLSQLSMDKDTDGDGLTDQNEYWTKTNPLLADTDGDGYSDKYESRFYNYGKGLDPNVFNDPNGDPDHDGYTTDEELKYGTNINNTFSNPATERVSLIVSANTAGAESDNGNSGNQMELSLEGVSNISETGRYVLFYNKGTNLIPGVSAHSGNLFRKDLKTNTVELVTVKDNGSPINNNSNNFQSGSMSGDGRYIVFSANDSGTISSGDTPGQTDVYLRDMQLGSTKAITANHKGNSYTPSISSDGRFIAFASDCSSLVENDTNAATDMFLFDRTTSSFKNCSRSYTGSAGGGAASYGRPIIGNSGRYVLFKSIASDLTTHTIQGDYGWYRFDRYTGKKLLVTPNKSGQPCRLTFKVNFSAKSKSILFQTSDNNAIEGLPQSATNNGVYRFNPTSGKTDLLVKLPQYSMHTPSSFIGGNFSPYWLQVVSRYNYQNYYMQNPTQYIRLSNQYTQKYEEFALTTTSASTISPFGSSMSDNGPDSVTERGDFLYIKNMSNNYYTPNPQIFISRWNDLDGDGLTDKWEFENGYNFRVPDNSNALTASGLTLMRTAALGLDPTVTDFDGDGINDKDEIENDLNPFIADAVNDSDGDGISNFFELKLGLDPTSADVGVNYIPLGKGWNMVSVPTALNGSLVNAVFPQAQSNIWTWDTTGGKYSVANDMTAVDTRGYWIFASEKSIARMDGKGALTVSSPVPDMVTSVGTGNKQISLSGVFKYTASSSVNMQIVSISSANNAISSHGITNGNFSFTPRANGTAAVLVKASVDGFEVFDEFLIKVK